MLRISENLRPALLLIDLQNDYLAAPNLQPAAAQIVANAASLLELARRTDIPILHIITSVQRHPDNRMPHWKAAPSASDSAANEGRWICEIGTPGHEIPPSLTPRVSEKIFHKQFFSAFGNAQLHSYLQSLTPTPTTLILAGIHLHACLRTTALDAYERGYSIIIAQDSVGSDDPLHAAITRRYLQDRSIRFESNAFLRQGVSSAPEFASPPVSSTSDPSKSNASSIALLANRYRNRPATTIEHRAALLRQFAAALAASEKTLARQITQDVGKPIRMATGEIRRSVELLHAVADYAASGYAGAAALEARSGKTARWHRVPLGLVAIITPWNNPVAISVGKIAPALLYGNAVLWKPAPAAAGIAQSLAELWQPYAENLLQLITGDNTAATALADHTDVDALSLSGSLRAGYALHERCLRRHIPFQAELGGNNAVILAEDADFASALPQIAAGAFDFAGQRCTANRRLIVPKARVSDCLESLAAATRNLVWGDPLNASTSIGPLINGEKRDEILAVLDRARDARLKVILPHQQQLDYTALMQRGPYVPPAIILCPDPAHELVQEEFFAPILAVQPADSFDHALALCNNVRQGLVAALFSKDPALQQKFLARAQAGVLKLNSPTADADATSPLGGWKASGIGPPEHGPADLEFFTRLQTIYEST